MSSLDIEVRHLPADVLGLPPVARPALAQGPEFSPAPTARSVSEIPEPVDRHDAGERGLLVESLARGLSETEPPPGVARSLERLARPGTSCVVTGQQPGFLCGPLLTLYKAQQAVSLARELEQRWGRPVVPLFWNHGDDHDVAEVHHSHVLNRNLDPQKLTLAGLSSGKQPVARLLLDEQAQRLGPLRAALVQLYGDHEHIEEALDLCFPRAGESLARTLTRALTRLLGPRGLVVLEPDWVRADLGRGLAQVLGRDPRPALDEGSRELESHGLEAPIDPAHATLLFRLGERGREALRPGGEGLRFEREEGSRTAEELAAWLVREPEAWSPGALTRPLVQDLALPTCAYIGGWGELAYHAQLGPLRDQAGVPRTPFVPRVGATLVDAQTRASAERLDVNLASFLATGGELPEGAKGPPAPAALGDLRAAAGRASDELLEHRAALGELERGFRGHLERAAGQMRENIEKLLKKAERVHQNNSGKGRRHARRLSGALLPRGVPQERLFGPLPWIARYGTAFVDSLADEWPGAGSEHLLLQLRADRGSSAV